MVSVTDLSSDAGCRTMVRVLLGVFCEPSAPFKCDEPWVCCADWPPRLLVGASPKPTHAPKPKDYCKARRHV